jgi:hypothetical protein
MFRGFFEDSDNLAYSDEYVDLLAWLQVDSIETLGRCHAGLRVPIGNIKVQTLMLI